jgi:hypothetical protein
VTGTTAVLGWENSWLNIGILGGSPSSSYVIQADFTLNGTYSYSTENLARIEPNTQVFINGQDVLNDSSNYILYCNDASPTCAHGSGGGFVLLSGMVSTRLRHSRKVTHVCFPKVTQLI